MFATIFQLYMWRHRCAGGLKKKLYLQSCSQCHRHFVGFFNVPVLHRRGATLFSSPEPKARVSYCHRAPSVVRPSVRPSSSVRPSGVNFHIFDFSSETAERNSTKLDRKQDLNALYQVCVFRADRKNKMAALASDWLRHFRLLLWNRWTEFNETWQEGRSQRPLPSLCFSGRSEKQDGRPGLWLAETFSTSPLKPLNGIQQNLTGSKISKPSTKFVFFGLIGKTRWRPWPLIGWDIFDFSSETAEWNSTKFDRKQDLNALYQVCVFRADRKKQDGRHGLWLAETFSTSPLKPLNEIQWNLTGSKISRPSTKFMSFWPIWKTRWPPWLLIGRDIFDFCSETAEPNSKKLDRKQDLKALYQVCVFRADWKNKMAALASDLLRHFRLLWRNRWTEFTETWQEASSQCLLYHVCVFQADREKTKWPTWPLIGWDIFDFSSETTERNSTKLDRKQDLNALYQVCVFQVDWNNKMAAPVYDLLRHFQLFLGNRWIEFNKTWQKASSQRPLPNLCFSSWSKKQYGRPGLWLAETYFDFSSETAERNSGKLDRKQDLNVLYQVCVCRAEKWIKSATLANPSKKVAHFKNFFSPEGYSNKANA